MSWLIKIKNNLSSIIIAILGALFLIERARQENTEEKLLNSETKAKDQELANQQKSLEQDNQNIKQQAEEEKKKEMSPDETEKFLKDL